MSGKRLLIAPSAEPISLTEAKAHLRVDVTDDDAMITALIIASRQHVEKETGRALVRQTWEQYYNEFPSEFRLPVCPLRSVSSITYQDIDNITQTLATSTYVVNRYETLGEIDPAYGQQWTQTYCIENAVKVTYSAGYAAPATVDTATDTFTSKSHDLSDGDPIVFTNTGGALPTGLAAATTYYVRDSTTDTFKVAATAGGVVIDITSAGTGTHFVGEVPGPIRAAMLLLIGHLYQNREAATVGVSVTETPMAFDALLAPYYVLN